MFQQAAKDADVSHGGRERAAFGPGVELMKEFAGGSFDLDLRDVALREVSAECFAMLLHVANLGSVRTGMEGKTILGGFVRHLNIEAIAEGDERVVRHLLFLVRGVASFRGA